MTLTKKILVITPRFPYPEAGACEQDRAEGLRQLLRLGFDVRVIAKCFDWQDKAAIQSYWRDQGVPVELVAYLGRKARGGMARRFPTSWDGAALEYDDPAMRLAVEKTLNAFRPDLAWFDYTYLWPLYPLFKKRGIPIAVRSINFEALHYLDEDGRSISHYLKFIPKFFTEVKTARSADILFAITPKEQTQYERAGAKRAMTLPLRSLYAKAQSHQPRRADVIHAVFSGSTYNVSHNRRALEFIVKELAPAALREFGTSFLFHVTGSKFPAELDAAVPENVEVEGFVDDLDGFLKGMDIALAPSFFGAGMQQKIFEPLTRGFPTITNERGLMGYDFAPGTDVLVGASVADYMAALRDLQSYERRLSLSENAKKKSRAQFNRDSVDSIVQRELEKI